MPRLPRLHRFFRGIVLVALAVPAAGCGGHDAPVVPSGRATVVRVIDGDTFVARVDDHEEHIRLIGIDSPETHKPDTPVECYGPEAAARLAQLLPVGSAVRLERDVETRDRYGRLLAYVYGVDGTMVEVTLAQEGFAGPLAIAPDIAHRAEIDQAVATARAGGAGLWRACGGFHVSGATRGGG